MYGFLGWFGLGFVMCGGHDWTSVDRRQRISDTPFVEGTTESDLKGSITRTDNVRTALSRSVILVA